MGCGCGKNKKKNLKSSRMPSSSEPLKKIGNISIPIDMTPNQRRSTIAKIKNDTKYTTRKPNVADLLMRERIAKKRAL
jgi:hypothetical protein